MDDTRAGAHAAPRLPSDPPTWRAVWSSWPGINEPLLLLASPGRPWARGPGFTADQADAWYCAQCLRMIAWDGGHVVIPTLAAVTVHLDPALAVRVADRTWLEPALESFPADCRAAAHLGRTLVGVMFTGPRQVEPLSFQDFFLGLHAGDALIGDAPVINRDDHGRPR